MNGFDALQGLPTWGLAVIGVLIVVQLVLDVIALLDLYKRPSEELTIANKWIWAVIILLVSMFGAILYLIIGRKPALVAEVAPSAPVASRAARAADSLYGAREDVEGR
ncbi:MAG TPA: PLD nuclease N-terminal domain-containing protein [Coriobacteriia bacterium]